MQTIKIKLENKNEKIKLTPSTYSLEDMSKFIQLFCDVIKVYDKNAITDVHLEEVTNNCVSLKFSLANKTAISALAVFTLFGSGKREMPLDYQKKVEHLNQYIITKDLNFKMYGSNEDKPKLIINKENPLPIMNTITHKFYTRLYGELTNIGGKTKTNAHITPLNSSNNIICNVDKEMARKLASRLYTIVELCGEATMENGELKTLDVKSIGPYKGTPNINPFEKLAEIIGDDFKDIDPVEYVNEIRGR